ncbi:MAG: DUF488 domain-containing protein [SAR202 cluster bacterium]|nr:DUF488 domain-containing protein [SAR202 cluster bacterium]
MPKAIYTIGHSNHTWDTFTPLLLRHGIRTLVDVRAHSVSRFALFANKTRLPGLLESIGKRYVYMGDTLGGGPADPACYDVSGSPSYEEIAARPWFRQGLAELERIPGESVTAIMCAEEDPAKCHRALLIGAALEGRGWEVRHMRKATPPSSRTTP